MLTTAGNNDYYLIRSVFVKKTNAEIIKLGLRVTPQRMAILEFLEGHRTHPTAEEIHHALLRKYPCISLKTVYKTLSRLVETGMIKELDIDPNSKRFDICKNPHNHFYCRICGNIYNVVYDVPISADNWLNEKNVEGHHVETIATHLKGVCKYCEATRP